MRRLMILIAVLVVLSCDKDTPCDTPDPPAPYGRADDTMTLDYYPTSRVVIYVYNCLEGEGVVVRYYRSDPCDEYEALEIRGQCPNE